MKSFENTDNSFTKETEDFFEQSVSGFLITDAKNIILRSNIRLANWLGSTVDELKGRRFYDLLSIGSKIYFETHLLPLLRMQGFFDEILIEVNDLSGKRLKFLLNAVERKKKDAHTQVIYYTLVKATDRVQYEQNLQFAKTIAEKELEVQKRNILLREQLIAVLGHDLRNPLGAISMAVQLLQEVLHDPYAKELLATLKRSSYRMSELIANIMDFARTRLGEGIIITPKQVVLDPILQQVADELKLIFPQREIITSIHITEPVHCDPDRIAQLVSNLLANALNHGNPNSPVFIHASNINKTLKISVTNTGKPIPESLQVFLFEPFTKEGDRPSKNGLGLGLYISAQIAQAHKGTLTYTSHENETCFTFSMPS